MNARQPHLAFAALATLIPTATPKPAPEPPPATCQHVTALEPSSPQAADSAAREITRTLDRWAQAIRSENVDSLARLITPAAEFWSRGAPPLRGRQAVAAAFRSVFDRFNMEQDFECVELIVAGDLAVLRGTEINRLVGEETPDTLTVRQRAFSILFRGANGEWAFARGMTSRPPGPATADPTR